MSSAIDTVLHEIQQSLHGTDPQQSDRLLELLRVPDRRVFVTGQGRSGLVAEMVAMRLMHYGFDAHAVGEATAPSIQHGDVLLIVSGSGRTPVSQAFAQIARDQGATIALITKDGTSPLADAADVTVVVAATPTTQFAGSLFEQSALLLLDAAILQLTDADAATYTAMQARHTNLQ